MRILPGYENVILKRERLSVEDETRPQEIRLVPWTSNVPFVVCPVTS